MVRDPFDPKLLEEDREHRETLEAMLAIEARSAEACRRPETLPSARPAKPPPPTPELFSQTETAHRLNMSLKTLKAHVEAGDIRYIVKGKGSKRPRRMFAEANIQELIENQARREACPSTSPKSRRTTSTTSKSNVVGFTALRAERTSEKPKR